MDMIKRIKSIFEKILIIKQIRIWVVIGIISQYIILIVGGFYTIKYINKFENIEDIIKMKIEKWRTSGCPTQVKQLEYLKILNKNREQNLKNMNKRMEGLKEIYLNKDHPAYCKIDYSGIERLSDQINKLAKKNILYPIDTIAIIGIFVATVFLYAVQFLGIYLSHRHARKVFLKGIISLDYKNKKIIFWTAFFIISAVFLCREVYTSFLVIEKPIYGWTSFCISEISWIIKLLIYICGALIPAYTFTWAYILSSKTFEPDIDLDAQDTKCGVGDYVLFLQTWSIVVSIFGLFPLFMWVNIIFKLDYDKVYLIDLLVFSIMTIIIVSRLLIRAISLRVKYHSKIKALGMKYEEIIESKFPGDPTVGFLGERWWSVPTSIMVIITAIWVLIKFFNLEEFLLGILK